MSAQVSELWVERLFSRLSVRYGRQWLAMWEGIDPAAVKADWEENLRGVFTRNPQAIAYGLENLPERVPTSDQFLTICKGAPLPRGSALPEPPAGPVDPARVAEALRAMQAIKARMQATSPAQQCIENIERIVAERGGVISRVQREMVQSCLRMPNTRSTLPGMSSMAEILGDVR